MTVSPVTVSRTVHRDRLPAEAAALLETGYRLALVSCRRDGTDLSVAYLFTDPPRQPQVELLVTVPADDAGVPSLSGLSFPAGQFERVNLDLFGVRPVGHPQPRRLLRHAHWPEDWHPMLHPAPVPDFGSDGQTYPFVPVEGEGVYEIAVGPVHAGIIEPGHFRFSVIGETILRLEPRLWFLHRGVEQAFEGRLPDDALHLAERIAGDTSIGHALAFTMAVEDAAGLAVTDEVRRERALLLELERLYNHVTDLGALANDAGFGIGNVHAQRLRERLMRLNQQVAGHRLLRGSITIDGSRILRLPDTRELASIAAEVTELVAITTDHPTVRDRFTGTGVLPAGQAVALGTLGYVARASGVDRDARRDIPFVDLGPDFTVPVAASGDVLARYLIRAREVDVSVAVIGYLAAALAHAKRPEAGPAASGGSGTGRAFVEGWRGTIAHRVELGQDGRIRRVKVVDPSFFNWPALPVALAETIVPDFPLTNKSFNQSYAGNDL